MPYAGPGTSHDRYTHPETNACLRTVVTSMTKPPDLSDASDQDVMAWAREGDEAARREIVRRHAPSVYDRTYRMVRHHEQAEDLTQETFLKMFRALERNGPERKPSAWILRIANNTAIDYVRRKRPDSTRSPLAMTPGQIDRHPMRMPTPRDTPTASTDLRGFGAAIVANWVARLPIIWRDNRCRTASLVPTL